MIEKPNLSVSQRYVQDLLSDNTEESEPFELSPLPEGYEPGWRLFVDDQEIKITNKAVFVQERMGISAIYGYQDYNRGKGGEPHGYDVIVIHEPGGGGVTTVPFMVHPETGEVYVAQVKEDRPLMGGKRWGVSAGFLEKGERPHEAARREVEEEIGRPATPPVITELANGLSSSAAFMNTSGKREDGANNGFSFFSAEFSYGDLEEVRMKDGSTVYILPAEQRDAEGDGIAEEIYGTIFEPISAAKARAKKSGSLGSVHAINELRDFLEANE